MKSGRKYDLLIALALLLLPLLWFWPQTFGGRTLLPADNLYQYQPWQSYAEQFGVRVPYDPLISDLVLENLPWKTFIVEQFALGGPPICCGTRAHSQACRSWRQANTQHSITFSLIFYFLPLWQAFGFFTALQLGLAAMGMFVFAARLGPAARRCSDRGGGVRVFRLLHRQRQLHHDDRGGCLAAPDSRDDRNHHTQAGAERHDPLFAGALCDRRARLFLSHPDPRRPRRDYLLRPVWSAPCSQPGA